MSEGLADDDTDGGVTTAAERPRGSIYTREFWLIFAATFALNSANNLFILFPLFIVKLGGGASTIGAVVATGSLAALLMRPLASRAIDRYGCRLTALSSVALDCVFVTLYTTVHSLGGTLYLVRALHGAVDGTARVALFALVYEVLPRERQGEAMATFSLSGMVPAAFGALLGEAIMRRWGFRVFFCAAGILCAAALFAVMNLSRDEPRALAKARAETAANGLPSYWLLLTMAPLMMLWIVTLLFGLTNAVRTSFVAPFAYQRGIHTVGVYFTIFAAVAVLVRLSGRMMDRIGLERMLAPSFLVLAAGIALVAGTGHTGVLEIAAVLGGLGHGFAYPAMTALIIRHTPEGATGRSSAIYTSVWDLSAMLGPYLLGLTAHHFGYPPMFLVAGGLGVIAAVCLLANPSEVPLLAAMAEAGGDALTDRPK